MSSADTTRSTSPTGFDEAAIRAQFPVLTDEHGSEVVYLDSGASAQKPAAVIDRMATFAAHHYANIHRGVYGLAQDADAAYEGGRRAAARFVNADPRGTIFTKNVTEALNLVARSWGEENLGPGDQIVLTELEHHANLVPWQVVAQKTGAELVWVTVQRDGSLDLSPLHEALAGGRVKMVACAHVSNVLGTILPVAEIIEAAHAAGALVTVDGAQAVPHMPVDVAELGADFYGWTAHKLYGPSGIGILHGRREVLEEMPPFLVGGDMISVVTKEGATWAPVPTKFEAGTPPIIEAAGLTAAIEFLDGIGMDAVREHGLEITRYALERLREVDDIWLYGPERAEHRGPLVAFSLDYAHPHDISEVLARRGICVRAGQHCAEPLNRAMGVSATTRASFAVHTTKADIDALVDGLGEVARIFR
ncbi:MAG: SufS family cysteine desulfurase [Solirubrobacteraceae bacterium]|nr:SufS family cysteine desulfurase [Solirubrobacteraceae bacterium]